MDERASEYIPRSAIAPAAPRFLRGVSGNAFRDSLDGTEPMATINEPVDAFDEPSSINEPVKSYVFSHTFLYIFIKFLML